MNKIIERLFLAYFLLKPYYLFDSGGIQIGDVFLIIAFVLYIIYSKFNLEMKNRLFSAVQANMLFVLFALLTFAINGTYFAVYGMQKFLLSSLYYLFIFMAIALFYVYAQRKSFLINVNKILKLNLVAQLAISLIGIGRDYSIDRYMGTFNDPNQFGFYILMSYFLIYAINLVLANKKQYDAPYFVMALFLIIQSASTGSLLGLAIFIILQIAYNLKGIVRLTYSKIRRVMYAVAGAIAVVIVIAVFTGLGSFKVQNSDTNTNAQVDGVAKRIQGKIDKADNNADITIWEDRGYDIMYKYPQYIPFGAGEGNYDRYVMATNNYGNEIHATLPSMLFYYGVIPFLIIGTWFYRVVKGVDKRLLIVYVALLAESFILLNQRQSLFWIVFVLGCLYYSNDKIIERHAV